YQDLANEAISSILARGLVPILAGGTPLYVKAVVENWSIPRVPPNPAFRARMEDEAARSGVEALSDCLRSVDPASAERCAGNLRRIIRALEVHAATGVPMSEQEGKGPSRWDTLELGLFRGRELLFAAIDQRTARMIEQGLVDEVRSLLASGVPEDAPAMASIGYRQLFPHLRGLQTLDEAMGAISADTRRYVRHQETWLRKSNRLTRLDPDADGWRDEAFRIVAAFLAS
ncbi:MAG: tRNA (adenosine(37)-N6)-dimethylallyltransferase MiaA, partial [Thermomicrobiales bacterium]